MILGFIAESRVSELRCDEMKITHSDVATAIPPLQSIARHINR